MEEETEDCKSQRPQTFIVRQCPLKKERGHEVGVSIEDGVDLGRSGD